MVRKIRLLSVAAMVSFMLATLPAISYAKGDQKCSLVHDGLTRTYEIHVPPIYDGKKAVPLLLALHGRKGTGEDMRNLTLYGFNRLSNAENFIVVYPNGISKSWNDGRDVTPAGRENIDDVGFIRALIEDLEKHYRIDPDRIYVAGMSNGAMFAHRVGCELSDIVAAIAPVAGTMPEVTSADCLPPRPQAVVLFHGTKDAFVPYKGGATRRNGNGRVLSAEDTARIWAEENSCDLDPVIKILPDTARDGTTVTQISYTNCKEDADVVFYKIIDGGHTWPGGWQYLPKILVGKTTRDINANKIIWAFFKSHPKK